MASAAGRTASRVCVSTFAAAERAAASQATSAADPYNASIQQLLRGRTSGFARATPSMPVADAAHIMAQRDAGSVLVLGESPAAYGAARSRLEGIVTERDILRAIPALVRDGATAAAVAATAGGGPVLRVSDIMSRDPRTVEATATVGECMEIMINGHFRHLPVMDHGDLIGVLSIRDLVEKITDEHRTQVTDLRLQLGRLASVLGDQLDDTKNAPSRAP
jgi:CBS domain-containing protein